MGKTTDPAERQKFIKLLLHDAGFVDTVSRGAAGDRVGVACVDAKFVIKDWAAHAGGYEGVPIFMNDGSETGAKFGLKMVGKANDFVEFGLVLGGLPSDAVGSVNGEVEGVGCLAEDCGSTVGWKQVQVFIDVVRVVIR